MGNVEYAIDKGIAEQHVGVSHVDLGTQYHGAWLALTTVHELEQLQVLLNRTVAIRAVGTWACSCTLLLGNHFGALLINVGAALLDEPYGKVPELLEIVAGIVNICPLETKPLNIVLDALDIFCIFLDRVGVVEAQVALTAIFLGQSEVDGDSFSVSDMQVSVWLWWETGLHSATVLTFGQIIDDFLLNEAYRLFLFCLVLNNLFHIYISKFSITLFLSHLMLANIWPHSSGAPDRFWQSYGCQKSLLWRTYTDSRAVYGSVRRRYLPRMQS